MTTTMQEPEYDEATRSSMLALGLLEDSLCPLCGGPRWECQKGQEFVADVPVRCGRTTARIVAAQNAQEQYDNPGALLWGVVQRDMPSTAADDEAAE